MFTPFITYCEINLALQSPANRRRARTLPTRSTRALVYAGDGCTFKLILRTGRRRAPEASGHRQQPRGKATRQYSVPISPRQRRMWQSQTLFSYLGATSCPLLKGIMAVCLSVIFHNSRSAALSLQYVNNANGRRPNGVGRVKRGERGAPHCEDVRVCVGCGGGVGSTWHTFRSLSSCLPRGPLFHRAHRQRYDVTEKGSEPTLVTLQCVQCVLLI